MPSNIFILCIIFNVAQPTALNPFKAFAQTEIIFPKTSRNICKLINEKHFVKFTKTSEGLAGMLSRMVVKLVDNVHLRMPLLTGH